MHSVLAARADSFLWRFNVAGGPYRQTTTPELQALRAEDPARFDELRASYEARFAEQEAAESAASEAAAKAALVAEQRRRRERILASGSTFRDGVVEALVADALQSTPALTAVRDWFSSRSKPWCILTGGTGSGKSVAAMALHVAHQRSVWLRAESVVRGFAGYFGDSLEFQDAAKKARLLCVDDLGTETDAARMTAALLELFDARMSERHAPTVVTTNLTKRELRDRYPNERLFSRFASCVAWLELESPDMRRKAVRP